MKRSMLVTAFGVAASLAVATTAFATNAPGGTTAVPLARGTLAEEVEVDVGDIKIETEGPVDVATVQVTFDKGGGSAGWHIHPGPVFVVVQSGEISVWTEDCEKTVYGVGDTFVEVGPDESMLVKNEAREADAVVIATFIVPPGATPLTVTTEHRCGLER